MTLKLLPASLHSQLAISQQRLQSDLDSAFHLIKMKQRYVYLAWIHVNSMSYGSGRRLLCFTIYLRFDGWYFKKIYYVPVSYCLSCCFWYLKMFTSNVFFIKQCLIGYNTLWIKWKIILKYTVLFPAKEPIILKVFMLSRSIAVCHCILSV